MLETGRPCPRPNVIPDGSLADGREAKESNDTIAAPGRLDFDLPMPVVLTPARRP